jgi:hypothetical protein
MPYVFEDEQPQAQGRYVFEDEGDTTAQSPARSEFQSSSATHKFLVGAGKGMMDVAAGGKQFALEAGERFGMVKPGSAAAYTKAHEAENALYESYASPEPGKPWYKPTAQGLGEAVGTAAPYAIIPGGAEEGLGMRALTSAAQGALMGETSFVPEDGSRIKQALTGAAVGAGASLALSAAGKPINAALGNAPETKAARLAKQHGIRTTLGEETGNPLVQHAETLLEKVPVVGIGGFRKAQMEEANDAANRFISKYIVNPEAADIEAANRDFTSGLYEQLKTKVAGVENQAIAPSETRRASAELLDRYPDTFKLFQDTKTEALIKNIVTDTSDKVTPKSASLVLDKAGKPFVTAESREPMSATFNQMWELRKGVGQKLKQAKKKLESGDIDQTQYGQMSALYSAISKDIDKWIDSIRRPDIKESFSAANDAYKTYVAKYDILQNAYTKAKVKVGTEDMISPQKLSTNLTKMLDKDTKRKVFTPEETKQISGLANIMQIVKRAGQYTENPPTGQRWGAAGSLAAPAAIAKFVAGNPAAIKVLATEAGTAALGRFLTTTPAGKRLVMAASRVEPGSPSMAKLMEQIYTQAPKFAAAAAQDKSTPKDTDNAQ